jgi:hypothetical protein
MLTEKRERMDRIGGKLFNAVPYRAAPLLARSVAAPGQRFVSPAMSRPVSAAAPQMGTMSALAPAGHAVQRMTAPGQRRVIQRSVSSDLKAGDASLAKLNNYHQEVMSELDEYKDIVRSLNRFGPGDYQNMAAVMAKGYKVWAENYYNKGQASLYEAQKVSQKTNWDKEKYANLGTNTTLLPDVEIHKYDDANDSWSSHALELKTTTVPGEKASSKQILEGLEQLKKRKGLANSFGVPFDGHSLHFHNDHPDNIYPLTDSRLSKGYAGVLGDVDWDEELDRRVEPETKKRKVKPKVKLERNGQTYAKLQF